MLSYIAAITMLAAGVALQMPQEPGPALMERAAGLSQNVASVPNAAPVTIPAAQLLDLIDLPPLPFTMYSWPVDLEVLRVDWNGPFLREFARITGSLGVNDWYTPNDLIRAAKIAREAGVKLTLNTSPFYRVKQCNPDPLDWSDTGEEIAYVQAFLVTALRLDLPVGAIAYDSECYQANHPMVTARLDVVYRLAKMMYPKVPVYWYRNGDWDPMLDVENDGNRGLMWYRTYSAAHTEGWRDRWVEKLTEAGRPVLPWAIWTTLGPGYRNGWEWDLGLDRLHYWYLGRMLAAEPAPAAVLLYPGPYRPSCTSFHQAFTAFVRGANGLALQ